MKKKLLGLVAVVLAAVLAYFGLGGVKSDTQQAADAGLAPAKPVVSVPAKANDAGAAADAAGAAKKQEKATDGGGR
jgi:hypothetical protein